MTDFYILTFDIGTSSCKATLFDADLRIVAEGKGTYPLNVLQNGWVEQSPAEILAGLGEAVRQLSTKTNKLENTAAISFSSQMSAQCLVGYDNKPLTNIISWMDKRATEEVEEFTSHFARQAVIDMTGMDMIITPAYSITKLMWLKKNFPELVEKAKYFVQPKELVIHSLTGKWVSDITSLKGLVNSETGKPVSEIMEYIGVPESILPEALQPYKIAGYLLPETEGFEKLKPGIPVIVGWNDMNAAFFGMTGFPEECVGLDMTGTSEHFGVVSSLDVQPQGYDGLNKVPFLNNRNVYYGVTSSGGQVAEWFSNKVLKYDSVSACVSQLPSYDEFPMEETADLIFLPYIQGERNPWNVPQVRGSWIGLDRIHEQKHLIWSVLEGVCFALRAMYDRFPEKPSRIILSGGASNNDLWNQMKADVMGIPFVRPANTEAGCVGAALLALRALYPDWSQEKINGSLPEAARVYVPNEHRKSYYDKKYNRFLNLFSELEKDFY